MREERKVEATEVFEWYDGLVLGLVRMGNLCFLACLLAFDPDTKRRHYALVPVSEERANRLRALFKALGPQALDEVVLSETLDQCAEVYMTRSEPQDGKFVTFAKATPAEVSRLPTLSFPLVDKAVAARAILDWLTD